MSESKKQPAATIIGFGLIGGSIGLKLKSLGWHVSCVDEDQNVQKEAIEVNAADSIGFDTKSDLVIIATPVGGVEAAVKNALEISDAVVTDVGSTKAEICRSINNPRFVGGHPMAGSEQDGLSGANESMFDGALWVLTPSESTSDESYSFVRKFVISLGADCVTLDPKVHDQIVAQVSHVPHLIAASLMNSAASKSDERTVLLRLAAGGFRDMTRISAGRASIWPDICLANSEAIIDGLDSMIDSLSTMKIWMQNQDRQQILTHLESARSARMNLPVNFGSDSDLSEVILPVLDQPGEIAAVTSLAAKLDVNIFDLEISHTAEGMRGVMVLIVESESGPKFIEELKQIGYTPKINSIINLDSDE